VTGMTPADISAVAGTWGLAIFILLFGAVVVYAMWPGNKAKFERAARRPLEED
jgi:cytochrome c oxidase cbb3-type subunit 4